MKKADEVAKVRTVFCVIMLIWMLMLVSTSDYETELMEQQNWCAMVDDGFWGADPAEYQRRCGDQQ